jgi:hypothetical protein
MESARKRSASGGRKQGREKPCIGKRRRARRLLTRAPVFASDHPDPVHDARRVLTLCSFRTRPRLPVSRVKSPY